MSNPWGNQQPFDPAAFPTAGGTDQPPPVDYGSAYGYPASPAGPGPGGTMPPPYQPPPYQPYPGGFPMSRPEQPQAVPAMVLGILGLVCCGLASPFAIWLGRKSTREIDASGGWLSGRGQAQAGFIMGIIGTAMWALGILFYMALFAFGVAASWTPGAVTGT